MAAPPHRAWDFFSMLTEPTGLNSVSPKSMSTKNPWMGLPWKQDQVKRRLHGIGVNPKFNVADVSIREENKNTPCVVPYDCGLSIWDKPAQYQQDRVMLSAVSKLPELWRLIPRPSHPVVVVVQASQGLRSFYLKSKGSFSG